MKMCLCAFPRRTKALEMIAVREAKGQVSIVPSDSLFSGGFRISYGKGGDENYSNNNPHQPSLAPPSSEVRVMFPRRASSCDNKVTSQLARPNQARPSFVVPLGKLCPN
ncbi:hypothetical protein Pint_20873 [Pistacia integerrima]|uniref:Uncharacterized protein n=1 Tax=Pistacia integerrima TaxID=434235 RepID=A0ACC0XDY1_9ROSI|nr:hypothetical protein Pint_20873 [Pistacia integerrima]